MNDEFAYSCLRPVVQILCKVCPEAGQPCVEEGWLEAGAKMRDIMLALDPLMGRPVSANQNAWLGNASILTLQGIDYAPRSYDECHANAPLLPTIGSEVSSAYSDRAIAFNDEIGGHVRAYDTEFPAWGNSAQDAWQSIWSRPFMAGGFSWTGFDYRGEPTPYQWPNVASHFGILDSAGFRKDRAFWYEAWNLQPRPTPVLHLFPHWNFVSDQEIDVWAYSNADEVELFLNGASLGRSACGNYSHAAWPAIPWIAGELRAVAYFHTAPSEPVATAVVRTTGPPQALRLSFKDGFGADGVYADGRDVALLQVEVLDARGDTVPYADTLVEFSVQGGEAVMQILGTGNGDPSCHIPGGSRVRPAFGGRVLAVLQSTAAGAAGGTTVAVHARAPADAGVASDVLEVVMRACDSGSGCARVREL
jgi:beta-galactosidase